MEMVHVTIQTARFEEETQFYEKYVGLTIKRDMRGGDMDIVFMGDEAGGTLVEIINNDTVESAGGDGISIGFHTDDIEAKRVELQMAGVQVTPVLVPSPGVKFFFAKDPAGVTVQFI